MQIFSSKYIKEKQYAKNMQVCRFSNKGVEKQEKPKMLKK